jgi:hypothetical protein
MRPHDGTAALHLRFVASVILAALWLAAYCPVPAVYAKDNPERLGFSRVYSHNYDEVFEAAQETIERQGLFVKDKDKDKGIINVEGEYPDPYWGNVKMTFQIYVESVSSKPETRVTDRDVECKRGRACWGFFRSFPIELQKVLATYR